MEADTEDDDYYDDLIEIIPEDDNPPMDHPGWDYFFITPLDVGHHTFHTPREFYARRLEIYDQYVVPGVLPDWDWPCILEDMANVEDVESVEYACEIIRMYLLTSGTVLTQADLQAAFSGAPDPIPDFDVSDSIRRSIEDAFDRFGLDDLDLGTLHTGFRKLPRESGFIKPGTQKSGIPPPLAPSVPESMPLLLRLYPLLDDLSSLPQTLLVGECEWQHIISAVVPEFPSDSIDTYADFDTYLTGASNQRPRDKASVVFVFPDGYEVNIGSHGYTLDQPLDFPLDWEHTDYALSEFFSSPGGEGLTCPTPSHILHQSISAVLAMAISGESVEIEKSNVDIYIDGISIDLTTSAGIWSKDLHKGGRKKSATCAVSKYDIARVLLNYPSPEVSSLIAKSVANCLACEHPKMWQPAPEHISLDLKIQADILQAIRSLSARSLNHLSSMCYEAALQECVQSASAYDVNTHGEEYRLKADLLISKINSFGARASIAFPPIPVGEITGLPQKSIRFFVSGYEFQTGVWTTQGRSAGPRQDIDNSPKFLSDYPASGLVSYEESCELAALLDHHHLGSRGSCHDGPCSKYEGKDSDIMSIANTLYSQSAYCQYSEIMSDVARAVYNLPCPKPNVWQQVFIFMNKVSMFYRIRDPINSPEGYRIDWFAVSSFPVAGSIVIYDQDNVPLHLWPRQRVRSQELSHYHMLPRRLKLLYVSLIEKAIPTSMDVGTIQSAVNRIAIVAVSSTWATGVNMLTCRYLSSSLSSPSSPFGEMANKLKPPSTFADVFYLTRLKTVLENWTERDQYHERCALLDLPRSFTQLESYWVLWVPSEFADTNKHMASCVQALYDEFSDLKLTEACRVEDLSHQLMLIRQGSVTIDQLRTSLRHSCNLDTKGKLGWSWIGSLASAEALATRADPSAFDRQFGRGTTSRTLMSHLTVRHSARMNGDYLEKGTVAQMILDSGQDSYLSTVTPTFRFLFINRPIFFNHPKKGENKDREISITDPDSRICLSDAELICGEYGKGTGVDYLKVPDKDARFYRASYRSLAQGGCIQSSDASRYGPMMSNMAISIMLTRLGTESMHLKWAAVVYGRLAFRWMLIPKSLMQFFDKMTRHSDTRDHGNACWEWLNSMDIAGYDTQGPIGKYCTSTHMGQGMSHHSSSLLHAGGLILTVNSAHCFEIVVDNRTCKIHCDIMVTSDDSTLIVTAASKDKSYSLLRSQRQKASRIFLGLQRSSRCIGLRMVSVLPNLVKEVIAGNKGEFNSQDTGIGRSCPILGFRELYSLVTPPSSPSLVGDYLNAYSNSRSVAFAGQGLSIGNMMHAICIDAIEERWKLSASHKDFLTTCGLIPHAMIIGAGGSDLIRSPSSMLHGATRSKLLSISVDANASNEDVDPHVRDSVFGPLMHVRVSMSRQHRKAISCIKTLATTLKTQGYKHQSTMLESSLRATMSSARTRNLGRVAMRISGRYVRPRDFLDHKFVRAPMLESTLTWISHLRQMVQSAKPSNEIIDTSLTLGGHMYLGAAIPFGYPLPPTRRRVAAPVINKPRFIENGYGMTPWGRHALDRSKTVSVPKIGAPEREAMQLALALSRHRFITEHVEYGNGLVESWRNMVGARVMSIAVKLEEQMGDLAELKLGSFDEDSLVFLKQLVADHPRAPVLALHRYDGLSALYHCVHQGAAWTVRRQGKLDIEHRSFVRHMDNDKGVEVILACQGVTDEWQGNGPTELELANYQSGLIELPHPKIVTDVETQNMGDGASATVPDYSTIIRVDDEDILIYTVPEPMLQSRGNRRHFPGSRRIKYFRSKVISALAVGGYWYNNLRGVAFRAFLKGQFCQETVWTGGVLGWKASATTMPSYQTEIDASFRNVRSVLVLNGFRSEAELGNVEGNIAATGTYVVSGSNTRRFDQSYQVGPRYIGLIVSANSGQRHFYGHETGCLFNIVYPSEAPEPECDPADAVDGIIEMLYG